MRLSPQSLTVQGLALGWALACSFSQDIVLGGRPPAGVGGQGTTGGQASTGGSQGGGQPLGGEGGGVGGTTQSGGAPGAGGRANEGGQGGDGPSVVAVVSAIRPLTELNTDDKDDNPTLTSDELMICFTSKRPTTSGGTDIWCAERATQDEPFGEALEQTSLNSSGFESSPSLGQDGLSLWFSSDESEHLDIYVAMRPDRAAPWETPARIDELNSDEDDIPRPLAHSGLIMPLASRRDSPDYWTYLASRPSQSEPFGEPRLIEELASEGDSFVDAFLLEDGLTMFFTFVPEGQDPDLYLATRPNLAEPFGAAHPLQGVNTDAEERDPFVSPDGKRLYFSSSREGELDLFVADLSLESP